MKDKKHYYAWASNDQGASMDVTHGTSKRALADQARRTLGSDWVVHIERVEVSGASTEVEKFRIR